MTSNTFEVNGIQLDRDETRKGKVLYDYEAENDGELSVTGDQVMCSVHVRTCLSVCLS